MNAPIRLIATRWLYDHATKTLFSSDLFTHVWRDVESGPWFVTEADNDSTSPSDVRSFMLNTRYWWLEGAPTDSIRRGIGAIFDKYDIETTGARLRLHSLRPQRGSAPLPDAR